VSEYIVESLFFVK